jgi:hypothetical protein
MMDPGRYFPQRQDASQSRAVTTCDVEWLTGGCLLIRLPLRRSAKYPSDNLGPSKLPRGNKKRRVDPTKIRGVGERARRPHLVPQGWVPAELSVLLS